MRHRKGFNHLGRTSAHRKALLSNMAASLILNKRITTTTAKAKALRSYVEPLITKSKDDSTHSRRVVFSYLKNKYAVSELFREVSPKVAERPGGYTRILKLGNRLGDNADMCLIELVDYNENMLEDGGKKAKPSRRRRAGAKKKSDNAVAAAASIETAVEEVEDIQPDSDTVDSGAVEMETAGEVAEDNVEPVTGDNKETADHEEKAAEIETVDEATGEAEVEVKAEEQSIPGDDTVSGTEEEEDKKE